MAFYDYRCPGCNRIQEVSHRMSETPVVTCTCGTVMRKKISLCGVIVRGSLGASKARDQQRRDADLQTEIREVHGVEKVMPFRGASMQEVYNDIKGSGSYVRESMAAEQEKNVARRNAKLKEWKPGAHQRAAKKRQAMIAQKKAEAAAKRSIRLTT